MGSADAFGSGTPNPVEGGRCHIRLVSELDRRLNGQPAGVFTVGVRHWSASFPQCGRGAGVSGRCFSMSCATLFESMNPALTASSVPGKQATACSAGDGLAGRFPERVVLSISADVGKYGNLRSWAVRRASGCGGGCLLPSIRGGAMARSRWRCYCCRGRLRWRRCFATITWTVAQ